MRVEFYDWSIGAWVMVPQLQCIGTEQGMQACAAHTAIALGALEPHRFSTLPTWRVQPG